MCIQVHPLHACEKNYPSDKYCTLQKDRPSKCHRFPCVYASMVTRCRWVGSFWKITSQEYFQQINFVTSAAFDFFFLEYVCSVSLY
jgi:hypothetical protein